MQEKYKAVSYSQRYNMQGNPLIKQQTRLYDTEILFVPLESYEFLSLMSQANEFCFNIVKENV